MFRLLALVCVYQPWRDRCSWFNPHAHISPAKGTIFSCQYSEPEHFRHSLTRSKRTWGLVAADGGNSVILSDSAAVNTFIELVECVEGQMQRRLTQSFYESLSWLYYISECAVSSVYTSAAGLIYSVFTNEWYLLHSKHTHDDDDDAAVENKQMLLLIMCLCVVDCCIFIGLSWF